jgi:signal transduction histidine kinase
VRRRLLLGYVLFTLVVVLILEVPFGVVLVRRENDEFSTSLHRQARTFAVLAEAELEEVGPGPLQALATQFRASAGPDLVVLDIDAKVIADTGHPAVATGSMPFDAATVASVRLGRSVQTMMQLRPSGPREQVVLLSIGAPGDMHGFIAASKSRASVVDKVRDEILGLGLLGLSIVALAVAAALAISRSLSRPLRDLGATARALGTGNLAARADTRRGPPDIRELASTVNDMADRLEQLVRAQRTFVADASHQLRTPLTALRLRLDTLEDVIGEDRHADYELVIAETQRLSRLVDGLLALARAEGMHAERQPLDLVASVDERVDLWSALADERGVTLAADLPETPAVASLVPGHLEQILDNLIANALDVVDRGGRIDVDVASTPTGATVTVTDNGPGLTPDECAHAFDRFWRGRLQGNSRNGSGLGLAIVAELVRANYGTVSLVPRNPHGLTATVRFDSAPVV